MYSAYQVFAFFIYYAIAGWCLEVIYAAIAHRKFVNRGFLNGPVCPIYGVGAIIVIYCLTPFENLIEGRWFVNLLLLFLSSVILTSVLELIVGWVLEHFFHQKWWDYTDDPLNFKGYVCLPFSLMWGACCVALMRLIHPLVLTIVAKIPLRGHYAFFFVFYGLFVIDLVITIAELAKIGRSIRLASDLDRFLNTISGVIGKPISSGTLFSIEQKNRVEKAYHSFIGKAKSWYGDRYKDYRIKLSPVHKRIQAAYPNLRLADTEDVGAKLSKLTDFFAKFKKAFDRNGRNSGIDEPVPADDINEAAEAENITE